MIDLHTILKDHEPRHRSGNDSGPIQSMQQKAPSTSEIPDLFFDEILVEFKLNRIEIMLLMYLYRRVWSKPNLYRVFGISQLLSHSEMALHLALSIEEIYNALRKLEEFGFISTIRSGQYFVRKYFAKEKDERYGQTYDDFEVRS